jgi:insertion element IS1 protein InsB
VSPHHFPPALPRQRAPPCGETADRGHDLERQWGPRYRPRFGGQFGYRYRRAQKKEPDLVQVNESVLQSLDIAQVKVIVRKVKDAEMDEMWSFVGKKRQQRWLWHAIDHHTGKVLAYVFGRRKDTVFLELKSLLSPFGITRFYTDDWGAYRRHIDADQHTVGKQHTQKIEQKHTTFRARIKRLARKTICFSKSMQLHDIVVGLFINRFEFGRAV